jgi:ABC-2 type transport system permease protein
MPWNALLTKPGGPTMLMAGIIGIAMFLTATNAITATSLSREGKEFFISKYIPLAYKKQIQAKLLSGFIFSGLGSLLLLIAANIMVPLDLANNITILVVSLVAIIPIIETGLLIDILHPKLDWDNEQKAVKQNINVIWAMLSSILMGGGVLYSVIRFFQDLTTAAAFMLGCFGLLALVIYYWLMSRGIQLYRRLEG